jgi:hypothetical protein
MRSFDTSLRYKSYLLRCWQEQDRSQTSPSRIWRFALQDTRSGKQRGFASIEALMAYLQAALAEEDDTERL